MHLEYRTYFNLSKSTLDGQASQGKGDIHVSTNHRLVAVHSGTMYSRMAVVHQLTASWLMKIEILH